MAHFRAGFENMQDFFTGLQFLTRIRITRQQEWSAENFGRSVKYFPLVGAVLGVLLAALYYLLQGYLPLVARYMPVNVIAVLVVAANIFLTGGLHCDGLMDTMDGIFSGRSREKMLEIMKDSRVGANGAIAFGILLLAKWSLLLDLSPSVLPVALFAMPILGRFSMVMAITLFPYARPEGIGKAFAQFAGRHALLTAALFTAFFIIPLGKEAVAGWGITSLFTLIFCRYVTRLLGGLTGDVYGAVTELSEVLILLVFLF
ncbi:adenosylcobinamide-gdp ribazoletransferase [Lucifera butyrica]|uniref:Adenosylcobinamide-GDP ribazoletransferase n=1 Tax=Lucifera butyrica TaxID=1351585 RepID=A0A498R6K1_9FIRM|nr:adenosylcobinamide-GDP ribazoletransferase [Lucifera butyrica]VBB06829.1 adenosylcobinamide-gdp ribazoletransferase [Lucifera butyrica]